MKPGADYRQIRMQLPPEAHAAIHADGDLLFALSGGELRMRKPVIYQEGARGRTPIPGAFLMRDDGTIGFSVGRYDHSRTLVIDPVLSFSTYVANVYSPAVSVATDAAGATYVTGYAQLGFPTTPGSFPGCSSCAQQQLVTYVSKYSADGSKLLYSTLFGSSLYTQPAAIGVDGAADAIVAGYTQAIDFPTKNGQPIGSTNNSTLAFVTSLSADGAALQYSTLLGGSTEQSSSTTQAAALTLDAAGNAYVSGLTDASAFPVTPGAIHSATPNYPDSSAFLSKFTPSGGLVNSGIVGDVTPQNGGGGLIGVARVAVDSSGSAYLTGQAGTLWPVTPGAYQQQIPGAQPYSAPFVTKISPDGGSIVYSTFFGPQGQMAGIDVLPNGNVWLVESPGSTAVPLTPDAYQTKPGATLISELDATGSHLVYSTFFGGPHTGASSLAIDADGDIWIAGSSNDGQLPLVKPLQSTVALQPPGFNSLTSFAAQFDPTGKTLKFSTYLGGTAVGYAVGVAIDANHRAHVAGAAQTGLYTTHGAYLEQVPPDPPNVTYLYGYAALLDPAKDAPALCVGQLGLSWFDTAAGSSTDQVFTITSCGTLPLSISSIQTAGSPFSVPADTDQCPQNLPVGQSCSAVVRFSPTAKQSYTSTLTVVSNAPVTEAVIGLKGAGVIPQLIVSNVSFDYALVGQTSAPQMLYLQNAGGAAITLDYAKSTVSGDFSLVTQACSTILPGDECGIPVIFSPKAVGQRTGAFHIVSNDPVNPVVTVPLEGVGYSAAPLPQITAVNHSTIAAGSVGVTLGVSGFGFLPSSVVQVSGKVQNTYADSRRGHQQSLSGHSLRPHPHAECWPDLRTGREKAIRLGARQRTPQCEHHTPHRSHNQHY